MSKVSLALRRRVEQRALGLCEYCRSCAEYTGHDFTVDHIQPESLGGLSSFDNLYWSCFWCNNFKHASTHARDPRSGQLVPLYNPRMDAWPEYFRWSRTQTRNIGRTPVSRATVNAFRLNRPVLILARTVWVKHGLHPPIEGR